MTPFDSLWDIDSGNSIGTFESKDGALAVASAVLETNGEDLVQVLDLGRHDGEAGFSVAMGAALLDRVQAWRARRVDACRGATKPGQPRRRPAPGAPLRPDRPLAGRR